MEYIDNIFFIIISIIGFGLFAYHLKKLNRNIKLGQPNTRTDNSALRWKTMTKIALGQSKMTKRPVAGIMHILVYAGFLIINVELIEIIIDGIFGTHRFLKTIFGNVTYDVFTSILEVFAILVIIGVIIFFIRRNMLSIKRLISGELKGFPKNDANFILVFEFLLMSAFLMMNASDFYINKEGGFPISSSLFSLFKGFSSETLHIIERVCWWFHYVGILFFMNYLYVSKHLHILLAFPASYFSNLNKLGAFNNLESVTQEVKTMLDPEGDPYAESTSEEISKFGASDIFDLNQVQLLQSYTCTECGRCSDVCPAHQTGKLLSPRKIMMATRDRLEEVSKNIDSNKGDFVDDNKKLLNDHISTEELWACTTCNACTDACPILLDPLSIILEMRRYLVMEESSAPQELNLMMTNVENNGAPWQYNQQDRGNWAKE